ncbi:unnamed protein product [Bursaphelenchus xylophilus]|uniref:(pine wood nematode) hypothetical protein n=1 Tax=Bursaphelenchus xylophilus TaxID=6326 RepID=A0A1I7SL70_BURXY|nr:unnamed protein product [Bursaphelenchus xylophilus]CAG9129389.1 unnamed protein product [Bursaphelenchus xylophilus]
MVLVKLKLEQFSTDAVELVKKRMKLVMQKKPKPIPLQPLDQPSPSQSPLPSRPDPHLEPTSPYFVKDYGKPQPEKEKVERKLSKEELAFQRTPTKIVTEFWVVTFYGRCIHIRQESSVYDLHSFLVGSN